MPIPFDHRLRADVPESGLDWQPAGAPAPIGAGTNRGFDTETVGAANATAGYWGYVGRLRFERKIVGGV